jgi:hypothetical protein
VSSFVSSFVPSLELPFTPSSYLNAHEGSPAFLSPLRKLPTWPSTRGIRNVTYKRRCSNGGTVGDVRWRSAPRGYQWKGVLKYWWARDRIALHLRLGMWRNTYINSGLQLRPALLWDTTPTKSNCAQTAMNLETKAVHKLRNLHWQTV